jgi:predicted nucleic acid-binding protein
MRTVFDTSVLVAALVQPHPMHHRAFPWLKQAKAHEIDMIISSHTLAELYAVLTTLPVSPRISPDMAWRLINENIVKVASIISLKSSDYMTVIKELRDSGLPGGIVYDALLVQSAAKSNADNLLTFNVSDFDRLSFHADIKILSP